MGKKTIKEKPPLELQFDHVKDKITGWEKIQECGLANRALDYTFIRSIYRHGRVLQCYLWWQNHDWNSCRNHWYPDNYCCMDLVTEAFQRVRGMLEKKILTIRRATLLFLKKNDDNRKLIISFDTSQRKIRSWEEKKYFFT